MLHVRRKGLRTSTYISALNRALNQILIKQQQNIVIRQIKYLQQKNEYTLTAQSTLFHQ